jgi:transcriptional regulator with XRE-family HTH domain
MSAPAQIDWREWMRAHGQQVRRLREFLGLSQEQLAKLAGVSQGAVSRLEAGRGLATPMLVVMKITLAIVRGLRALDPAVLNDELRRLMQVETTISPPLGDIGSQIVPLTKDPQVEELVRLFRDVPERQRSTFLSVVRAIAAALSPTTGLRERDEVG